MFIYSYRYSKLLGPADLPIFVFAHLLCDFSFFSFQRKGKLAST